jgi:hypothetical protein
MRCAIARDGRESGADLRVDPEQEAGGRAERAGAGCEDRLGAFLRKMEDAEFLAALMVATAEAAGTRPWPC